MFMDDSTVGTILLYISTDVKYFLLVVCLLHVKLEPAIICSEKAENTFYLLKLRSPTTTAGL